MPYVDLDTIHVPASGKRPPATWGLAVNGNFDQLDSDVMSRLGAWASYVPSLVQGSAVSKTITYARYFKLGRLVVAQCYLSVTSNGVSNSAIQVGLPATAARASVPGGTWFLYDSSAGFNYTGVAYIATSTTMGGLLHGTNVVLGQNNSLSPAPPAQLGSGDTLLMTMTYESTT